MGDTFIISGLKEKRSAVAGQIVELRGQIDRLQADLFHLDDDRKVLNGVYWRLRTGSPWADIPERYGPYTTCYNRFVRWRKLGVWDAIFDAVSKAYEGSLQMVDSSSIRVHQHAANGKKGVRRTPPLGTSLQADAWGARAAD